MVTAIDAREGIVSAVFADREGAEAAIAELRALGLAEDEMGVIVPDPAHHRLLDDGVRETLKGLGHGILVGTPLGVLGGIAVVAAGAPGYDVIGLGGALLVGAPIGALWGAIVGAYFGLTGEVHRLEDIERTHELPLKPEEILVVVVAGQERAGAVGQVMERHGGSGLTAGALSQSAGGAS